MYIVNKDENGYILSIGIIGSVYEITEENCYYLDENGEQKVNEELLRDYKIQQALKTKDLSKINCWKEENGNFSFDEEKAKTIDIDTRTYSQKVEALIREKYSISDELAILRQRDIKTQEFDEYNSYAEECKKLAKNI